MNGPTKRLRPARLRTTADRHTGNDRTEGRAEGRAEGHAEGRAGTGRRVLVAIPCKDEETTVADVIRRVPRQLDATQGGGPETVLVDVVVIDDGSTDRTARVAEASGASVIRHTVNRGLGVAFQSASEAAIRGGYDALVTIDGDGQFAPEQIIELTRPVLDGSADAAVGSRFIAGAIVDGIPPVKRLGNAMVSFIVSRLAGERYHDVSCGFRCYSREALLRMNLQGRFTNTHETFLALAANRMRVIEVPVTVRYFPGRVSRVASSLVRYAWRTLGIMARWYRDYRPLRFFWGLAAIAALVGTAFSTLLAWHYLTTGSFTPFIFAGLLGGFFYLVALLLLLGGLLADMLLTQRVNQERLLYLMRQQAG
jgi:glycosyltransferase involved in cell wall biosynthesis